MTDFLLCIGCQKGGTTWLAEHLRRLPEARLGARKEMHVLDAHFLPASADWHAVRIARREAQIARMRAAGESPASFARIETEIGRYREAAALVPDLDAYARYFRDLAESAPGVRLVADLTPDYALLGAEHWREARAALERQGLRPKILFLMRDPVDRLESIWRMTARNETGAALRGRSLPERALRKARALARHAWAKMGLQPVGTGDKFLDFSRSQPNLDRSRFDATIAAVEAAFPAEDIHYEFYEALFTPEAFAGVMGFLGLPAGQADFAARVNASPMLLPIAPKEKAAVRGLLEPTYRFCADRFGAERIQAIWKNA